MIYFYARVSSASQNLSRQMASAKQYKQVDRVFSDKQSGKNMARPAYQEMKSLLQAGDEVVVHALDRLGRNKDAIKEELAWYKEHQVVLRILDVPTTLLEFGHQDWIRDMVSNILIEVMSSVAENERIKILERQAEGIAAMPVVNGKKVSARTGHNYGRTKLEIAGFEKILEKTKKGEVSITEACKQLGISRRTWYNRLEEIQS